MTIKTLLALRRVGPGTTTLTDVGEMQETLIDAAVAIIIPIITNLTTRWVGSKAGQVGARDDAGFHINFGASLADLKGGG